MTTKTQKPIVYGASWCSPCAATKQWLDKNRIPYTYIDLEEPQMSSEDMEKLGILSIPTVKYGAITITGHSPSELETVFKNHSHFSETS